jgi:hypothetical protein
MIEFEVTASKRELRRHNRGRIEPRLSRVRFCCGWDVDAGTLSPVIAK